jgi:hypothetical protein
VVLGLDVHSGLLDLGVRLEVRADQVVVPGPVVLGVGRGVHACVTATGGDVVLERGLLFGVQHVAGGGKPDHGAEAGKVLLGERGRVLGGLDVEVVLLTQRLDGGDAGRNGVVPESGGLGEDQDRAVVLCTGLGGRFG